MNYPVDAVLPVNVLPNAFARKNNREKYFWDPKSMPQPLMFTDIKHFHFSLLLIFSSPLSLKTFYDFYFFIIALRWYLSSEGWKIFEFMKNFQCRFHVFKSAESYFNKNIFSSIPFLLLYFYQLTNRIGGKNPQTKKYFFIIKGGMKKKMKSSLGFVCNFLWQAESCFVCKIC